MTTISDDFTNAFDEALDYGQQVRFKYYNQSIGAGSGYDDDVTLTQSGADLWVSGVQQPITSKQFSSEAVLLEQGKILLNDRALYVQGVVQTSGLTQIKVGLGSPVAAEYQVLGDNQLTTWNVNDVPICKKLYIRHLNNGSFIGE